MDEEQRKCGGLSLFGLIIFGMSVAGIVIGCLNIDSSTISGLGDDVTNLDAIASTCKVESKLPVYMLVAGILMIVLMLLRLFLAKCCAECAECGENNKCCATLNALCMFSAANLFDLAALGLIVAWLVAGSVWTFNVWNEVNTKTATDPNYCPGQVYNFCVALVIWQWITVATLILCGMLCRFCQCFFGILCCKPCRDASANQTV